VHNAGKGARYTQGRTPVSLVHNENYSNRSRALKREAEIKSWDRNEKLALINKK